MQLDLEKFRKINTQRAVEGFKTYKNVPLSFWGNALAGELGELCNMIKKLERVKLGGIDAGSSYKASNITPKMLKEEIGGVIIYMDLLASLLQISLEDAIIETFNDKSETYGFIKYNESPSTPTDMKDSITQEDVKREAIGFAKWISDNYWIREPFPRQDTGRTMWAIYGEGDNEELKTTEQLYNLYLQSKTQNP